MTEQPTLLIVEAEVLVRSPLAQYLRECGYLVLEASDAAEARQLLGEGLKQIDIVLADIDTVPADADAGGENGFALARWIRKTYPGIQIILAGSVATAAEKAGELCEDGPPEISKPYDHQLVLKHIKRLLAARERNGDN